MIDNGEMLTWILEYKASFLSDRATSTRDTRARGLLKFYKFVVDRCLFWNCQTHRDSMPICHIMDQQLLVQRDQNKPLKIVDDENFGKCWVRYTLLYSYINKNVTGRQQEDPMRGLPPSWPWHRWGREVGGWCIFGFAAPRASCPLFHFSSWQESLFSRNAR